MCFTFAKSRATSSRDFGCGSWIACNVPRYFFDLKAVTIRYDRSEDAIILTLSRGLAEQWPKSEGTDDPLEGASVFFEEFPVSLPLSYSLGAARIRRMRGITLGGIACHVAG
jgi:hypothetical protein